MANQPDPPLRVLSAMPFLLVFVDNVFSMPTVAPSADFPAVFSWMVVLSAARHDSGRSRQTCWTT